MNNLIRSCRPLFLACAALLAVLACAPAARAQTVEDQGDVVSGPATPVAIFIAKITGRAQYRLADGKGQAGQWQTARAGARLASGCTVRTGPASALELAIGANQVITLDRLTTVTLSQAFLDGDALQTARTRVELDVGRVKFDVNSHGFSNDLKIRTPDAVLAVVGTTGGVEFVGGVGSSAFGAITNTGTFVLTYADGSVATVTDQQETSAANPDPAANAAAESELNATESRSREPDEAELVSRSTGEGEVFLITTGVTSKPKPDQVDPDQIRDDVDPDDVPPPPDDQEPDPTDPDGDDDEEPNPDDPTGPIFIDDAVPALRRVLPGGVIDDISPIAGAVPSAEGGLAIRTNPATGRPQLIRLESSVVNGQVRNIVRGLELDAGGEPTGGFAVLFDRSQLEGLMPQLRGLAGLGGQIYAVGDDTFDHAVYHVDVDSGNMTKVMVPGIELQGAAAEASERGTIFIAGLEAGVARDDAALANTVILEVDPRINYLVDARSGLNGEFNGTNDTDNPDNVPLGDIGELTGMAFVDGVLTISAESPGGAVMVQYAPDRSNAPGAPRLMRIDAAHSISINGLSRDFSDMAAPSFALDNPAGAIDLTTLNSYFSSMAYSRRAFESGVVERSVRSEILKVARDPSACAASGALDTIAGMLESHVDQTAGVGRTVADFRASIFDGHPCQPPAGN